MLKKNELETFKDLLLSIQTRLRGDVRQIADGALDRNNGSGSRKNPTHNADVGTDAYDQDFSLRTVENEQETLEEIGEALSRIDEGVYGLCESCSNEGKPKSRAMILKTRLKAIPYTRNCIECERKREELSL
jgi:DnaK suppressor protein